MDSELQNAIRRAVIENLAKNRVSYGRGLNFSAIDDLVRQTMLELGVKECGETQLGLDLFNCFGLNSNTYENLPVTETEDYLPFEADLILKEWAEEKQDLKIVHENSYNYDGEVVRQPFYLIDDRQLPEVWGFLCTFKGSPHYLHFRLKQGQGRFVGWNISVTGTVGHLLLLQLKERINKHFIQLYKGKMLDFRMKEVVLKSYDRDKLIYPEALSKQIDEMIICFKNWFTSPLVTRWGNIFIGRPGTGKTTIGGLLSGLRPEGCTFLYCPAGEISSEAEIKKVFELAELLSPTILQIDDVDLISAQRRTHQHHNFTSVLMENLEGLRASSKIYILMTTNDPMNIEDAIINRAGRVSDKIIFDGYHECLMDLIQLGRNEFKLNLKDSDIKTAISGLNGSGDLTPDEAKNVCMRLHLSCGGNEISSLKLRETIDSVVDNFHGSRNH